MKKIFFPILLLILYACSPATPKNNNPNIPDIAMPSTVWYTNSSGEVIKLGNVYEWDYKKEKWVIFTTETGYTTRIFFDGEYNFSTYKNYDALFYNNTDDEKFRLFADAGSSTRSFFSFFKNKVILAFPLTLKKDPLEPPYEEKTGFYVFNQLVIDLGTDSPGYSPFIREKYDTYKDKLKSKYSSTKHPSYNLRQKNDLPTDLGIPLPGEHMLPLIFKDADGNVVYTTQG